MLLRSAIQTRRVHLDELRQKYLDAVEAEDDDAAMYEREFKQAQAALTTSVANLRRKEAALGVNEYDELEALATSEYMRARMNARALKLRLRERLRARKFEMDVVERAYRRLMNGKY
jgi:hypothetical protein